jgi:hypothetical protein
MESNEGDFIRDDLPTNVKSNWVFPNGRNGIVSSNNHLGVDDGSPERPMEIVRNDLWKE